MCLRKVSVGEIGEGLKGPMKSGHNKNMLSTYIQLLKNKKLQKITKAFEWEKCIARHFQKL